MNETRLCSLEQLKAFLDGTAGVQSDRSRATTRAMCTSRWCWGAWLKRGDKGVVLRYLGRTTGYSRQQLTRLVQQCLATGGLAKRYRPPAKGFGRTYITVDVALLAETDALHDTLSGPATLQVFDDSRYARLASISVVHLYNLRAASGYRARR